MPEAFEIPGGTMTWLMDDEIQPGVGISLAEMTLNMCETSELHSHANCSEVVHVIEGKISLRIDDEWYLMSSGDQRLIPAKSAHQARNIGEKTAKMILVYSKGSREYIKLD